MKARLVTWEPKTELFVVSRPVEFEEMEAFAGRAKAGVAELLANGELEVVTMEKLPGVLFPPGERGMLVTMFLSQDEMKETRERQGMARLFGVGKPRRPKRRR